MIPKLSRLPIGYRNSARNGRVYNLIFKMSAGYIKPPHYERYFYFLTTPFSLSFFS
jgi:hypothetical protein